MHDMTAAHLRSAFGGESMAHMRYRVWGAKAKADGFPHVARLFRAVSEAELVHATHHFHAMAGVAGAFPVTSMAGFGLGTTSENLAGAIEGETFEIDEMYPVYKEAAQSQGEKAAVLSFHYALAAEKTHQALFTGAKKAIDQGKDVALGLVSICGRCGHTLEGPIPDKCPICAVGKDHYTTVA